MKKRIITGFCIFIAMNLLICLLSGSYGYFTVLEYFNFYNKDGNLNFILLIFNVAYVVANIICINSLIEEKAQVSKYVHIRCSNKLAAYRHVLRLIKEVSLIVLTKIVSDLIFWLIFDRDNIKYFVCFSLLIYVTVLLWLMLFDCLSNLKIKNNILILLLIASIFVCYMLFRYSTWFSLLIIYPLDLNNLFAKAVLFKVLILLLVSFVNLIVKSKKEYY